jgi:hypothetical protein
VLLFWLLYLKLLLNFVGRRIGASFYWPASASYGPVLQLLSHPPLWQGIYSLSPCTVIRPMLDGLMLAAIMCCIWVSVTEQLSMLHKIWCHIQLGMCWPLYRCNRTWHVYIWKYILHACCNDNRSQKDVYRCLLLLSIII